MESYIVKTDGSWTTLKKISDVTEIQIIDPSEFEIAVIFNKHNIEFKDWVLDELRDLEGVISIHSKKEIDKYNKIYHIQHYNNSLETLCGINGRLGIKISFCESVKHNTNNLCLKCKESFQNIDYSIAINKMCENIYDEEEI